MVMTLRGLSGFGWDDTRFIASASDTVWDEYLHAHPKYTKWRKTDMPLFPLLESLYEGTLVTGLHSL